MSAVRAGLLARAQAWLIEPAAPAARRLEAAAPAAAPSATVVPRPVVAVCGVVPGCGVTTIARALAAELASRDPLRSAVVAGADGQGALPLASPAAARLARMVAERTGAEARPSGRLCVAHGADPATLDRALRGAAGVVLDAGRHEALAAASLADHVLLVAGPRTEPALAEIVAGSLARIGPEPLIVVNRAHVEPEAGDSPAERLRARPAPWRGRAQASVPSSPAAARLSLGCRGAGGAFGRAIALLADRCGGT